MKLRLPRNYAGLHRQQAADATRGSNLFSNSRRCRQADPVIDCILCARARQTCAWAGPDHPRITFSPPFSGDTVRYLVDCAKRPAGSC
jgi:hypothetical protein